MADAHNPTVRRRELGRRLRVLRSDAGLTVEQVAEQLFCSPSKISRIETGHRGAHTRDVWDLCDLYGIADNAVRQHLMDLASESRDPGWWREFDLPYATYVGLEAAAVAISDFEPGVFPGLLQTPGYARALHEGAFPRLPPEVIDQRIEVRRTRQRVLTRSDAPRLSVIVDEAVLHRVVGGPKVMAEQLAHIIQAAERENITVRVLPYSAGAHPALDSTFTLLEFASPLESVVYVEGLVGQIYVERPQEIHRYKQIYEDLEILAMSPQQSVELMAALQMSFAQDTPVDGGARYR